MARRRKNIKKKSFIPYLSIFAGLSVYLKTSNTALCIVTMAVILLLKPAFKLIRNIIKRRRYLNSSLYDIDHMDGHEFEDYLAVHFKSLGYRVKTVGTGGHDYGVDLVIQKDGETIAVQAKRYNQSVGIKAVQEILSGMVYYDADRAMVVTNSYFTAPAINLAEKGNVELWNREDCWKKFGRKNRERKYQKADK